MFRGSSGNPFPNSRSSCRACGTTPRYLVTGGLGMLGRSVAKWLVSKGAKHLVLTGRNANSDAAKELFSAEEVDGASIEVVACDISRDDDVRRLMRTISKKFPPLKGVVQSVGVLDDGILAQLDWDRFARVFEPKVYGSWLLHEYTKSLELDFFILQSSVLSLLGFCRPGELQRQQHICGFLGGSPSRRGLAGHGDQLVRLVRGRAGHRFGRSG